MKIIKLNLLVLIIVLIIVTLTYLGNNTIKVTNIKLNFRTLPEAFNNYKIVQLSDIHQKVFDNENKTLISKVKKAKPDIIVITGDLINASYSSDKNIDKLIDNLLDIAPIYYVTGNHEVANKAFSKFSKNLEQKGVNILRNSSEELKRNNDSILIVGVDDPITTEISENNFCRKLLSDEINKTLNSKNNKLFKILLSHRPEQFDLYVENKIDLTFSGHAHGGQVRIPFVGGLFAPNQGYFPQYTSGKYTKEQSTMIVSRGLGSGSFPVRIFNRPEIVVVTLKK